MFSKFITVLKEDFLNRLIYTYRKLESKNYKNNNNYNKINKRKIK